MQRLDDQDVAGRWQARLTRFVPEWIASVPALAAIAEDLDVVLHGSTTAGIEDPYSDIDLWGFVSRESLARADAASPTRFFELMVDGKPGHLNLECRDELRARVDRCDMHRLAEMRQARVIVNCSGAAPELIARALLPMPETVRHAWCCYHYVEMRSEHRACDTPLERGDTAALLLATTRTLEQALRCALVIDGEPYPYRKWLTRAASATPTGAIVAGQVQEMIDLFAAGALRLKGPEKAHPVSLKLREIRAAVVSAARISGIDAPWLGQWWLHLTQARAGLEQVRWPCG